MTLIVYTEGQLFADRRIQMKTSDGDYLFTEGRKLFVNPDKTVAFAACGSIPHDCDLDYYFLGFESIARGFDTIRKLDKAQTATEDEIILTSIKLDRAKTVGMIDEMAAILSKNHNGKIYVMTTELTFIMHGGRGKEAIEKIDNDRDLAYGTGEDYFFMARLNNIQTQLVFGMAARFDSSISPDFNNISRHQLKPVPSRRNKPRKGVSK